MKKTFIIAEVGINANGDIGIAKQLIDAAKFAGANAIKFQKRNIDKVYSKEDLDKSRISPWGTTQRQQKEGLEFGKEEYDIIDNYCKEKKIDWFATPWDIESVKFLEPYNCKFNKIASALLTYNILLEMIANQGKLSFISTGMSTLEEIDQAVDIFSIRHCPFHIMHCNSQYPMPDKEANLKVIPFLRERYKNNMYCEGIGWSGHETGLITSVGAVALGADSIERHITLDRAMYGSDQAASIEPMGFYRLVQYIRTIEEALGDGVKKITLAEDECKKKLRRNFDY